MKENVSISIFCIYAREDKELLDTLDKHFACLRKTASIELWSDQQISPGAEWRKEIARQLERAQIILLLISRDFMASRECYDRELQYAMKKHASGEARVIPILLRPVDWEGAVFSKLQMLPTNAVPVTSWADRDEAFVNIVQNIRRIIQERPGEAASKRRTRPRWRIALAGLLGFIVGLYLVADCISLGINYARDAFHSAAAHRGASPIVSSAVNPSLTPAATITPTLASFPTGEADGKRFEGKNPQYTNNCDQDAIPVGGKATMPPTQGTLNIFWSRRCQTAWARIYYDGPVLKDGETSNAAIYRSDGLNYTCDSPGGKRSDQAGGRFCYTPMVFTGDPGTVWATATFHSETTQQTLHCELGPVDTKTLR